MVKKYNLTTFRKDKKVVARMIRKYAKDRGETVTKISISKVDPKGEDAHWGANLRLRFSTKKRKKRRRK